MPTSLIFHLDSNFSNTDLIFLVNICTAGDILDVILGLGFSLYIIQN